LLRQQRHKEAIVAFEHVEEIDPNYQNVQYIIKSAKGKFKKRVEQETINIYYQRGLELIEQKDWLNALINFEKVKLVNPNYNDVNELIRQSNLKFNCSQKDISAPEPLDYIKWNPLLPVGICILAIFMSLGGVLMLFPITRARIYLLQKKYDKARQVYEDMLKYNPQNIKIYVSLSNIYSYENRNDEFAIKVFKRVIESNVSNDLKCHFTSIVNRYRLEQGKIESNSFNENFS